MSNRILVVDDEEKIREVLKTYGTAYGFDVDQASDGLEAIKLVENNAYECIVLDIMMPNMDGFTCCKHIKKLTEAPVIMLSARVEEYDKLYGFDLGIDDYVTKPFSPKELMARIKVAIERANRGKNKAAVEVTVRFEGIVVDKSAYKVFVNNEQKHLTNKEFDLLCLFLENCNVAFSREALIDQIWGDNFDGIERTVDTHIKMLRKNLGEYGDHIKTVRGVGYRFEA